MLPKHLDEKVARLHLDALGVKLTKLQPRAGRLHRRAGRGPVQARPLPLLAIRSRRRRCQDRRSDVADLGARPRPGARASSGRTGRCPSCARSASASRASGRSTGVRVARVPARHGRDGEPRPRAERGRGGGRAVRRQPALDRRTTSRRRSSSATASRSTRSTARTWRPTTATSSAVARHAARSVTLDDGADLISRCTPPHGAARPAILGGTEETTTGLVRLRALEAAGQARLPGPRRQRGAHRARLQRPLRHRPVDARRHPARDEPAARRAARRRPRLRLDRARHRAARARRRRAR